MFKGKILFIYYPENYLNIFSHDHLYNFVSELDFHGVSNREMDLQKCLMEYRSTIDELKNESLFLYADVLYKVFGYPSAKNVIVKGKTKEYPLISQVTFEFINQLPAIPSGNDPNSQHHSKIRNKKDYIKKAKSDLRLGERGEVLVVEAEKDRLINAGKKHLADKVDYVAKNKEGHGYDIESFDADETKRYIEVKSTTTPNGEQGFYISSNEYEVAKKLDNYYIYLVFNADTDHARIFPVRAPFTDNDGVFNKKTTQYHLKITKNKTES